MSHEEKIKQLERERKKIKLGMLKNDLDRLDFDIAAAETLEEMELFELKENHLKKRIEELEADLEKV